MINLKFGQILSPHINDTKNRKTNFTKLDTDSAGLLALGVDQLVLVELVPRVPKLLPTVLAP